MEENKKQLKAYQHLGRKSEDYQPYTDAATNDILPGEFSFLLLGASFLTTAAAWFCFCTHKKDKKKSLNKQLSINKVSAVQRIDKG